MLRVFKRLEQMNVVQYRSRRIVISDLEKLKEIAGFEGDYLHFSRRKDLQAPGAFA